MEESSPRPSQVIIIIVIVIVIVIFNIIAFIKIFVMIVSISAERRNMGKTSAFVGQARRIV